MLTAYLRSFPAIGLQIGSPSMLTSTAGVLLKKIAGGSALTPSTFFGMIWLVSIVGEHAIERDHALLDAGTPFGDLLDRSPRPASFASVGKVRLRDLELREAHEPLVQRDAGVGLDLDRAERRLRRRVLSPCTRPPRIAVICF